MAQPTKPPKRHQWLVGAPEGDHPILTELGRFHVAFATLEASLDVLMGVALGRDHAAGHAIMIRVKNIADRIEFIRATAESASHLTDEQKLRCAVACDHAAALNARRNVYAHGLYEHHGDKIRVKPFAFSTRKSQAEVLKLSRVKQDVEQISAVLFSTLYFTGLIPDEILKKLEASRGKRRKPTRPKASRT